MSRWFVIKLVVLIINFTSKRQFVPYDYDGTTARLPWTSYPSAIHGFSLCYNYS